MDKITSELEELKLMQLYPRLYLANYFSELKRQVDLDFFYKMEENEKYIEMINRIQLFENDSYNKIKPFNTFNKDFEFVEQLVNNGNEVQAIKLIDEIKYKIERTLFSNRSIMYLKKYRSIEKPFLLIIQDEYLRKNTFYDKSECLTRRKLIIQILGSKHRNSKMYDQFNREKLAAYFLKKKLNKKLNDMNNVLNLSIDIKKQSYSKL